MEDFKKLLEKNELADDDTSVDMTHHLASKKIIFNKEQLLAIEACDNFIKHGDPNDYFLIEGKAGTGKTTIIAEVLSKYKHRQILTCALSHKAKSVIEKVMKVNSIPSTFLSIAGALGMEMDMETGLFKDSNRGHKERPIHNSTIIIVDEASMVNEETIQLIFTYKKEFAKVIFLGDIGQLPPIRSKENPFYSKWDRDDLDKISPVFETLNKVKLIERVRQGEDSPILAFADNFWNNSQLDTPLYNPVKIGDRKTIINNKGAIIFVNKSSEIIKQIVPLFRKSADECNHNLVKFITYKNDTKSEINRFIHNKLFKGNEDLFSKGDLIIFNDNFSVGSVKLENSTEKQIIKISEPIITDKYGIKYYNCMVEHNEDNKRSALDLMVLHPDSYSKYKALVSDLFKLAFSYKFKKDKKSDYINYLQTAWGVKNMFANIDYSYGITSHKCISEDAKIYTHRGLIPLKDVKVNDFVDTGNGIYKKVLSKINTNLKEVYKIKTKNGYSTEATIDHRFLDSDNNFKPLKEFNIGDKIPISRNVNIPVIDTSINNISYYLGLVVGDGWYNTSTKSNNKIELTIPTLDIDILGYIPNGNVYNVKKSKTVKHIIENKIFRNRMDSLGLERVSNKDKRIPKKIFTANLRNKSAFIRGLFDSDGSISLIKGIRFSNSVHEIIIDIQKLLLEFGIVSKIIKTKLYKHYDQHYQLNIDGINIIKYRKYIGFSVKRKKEILDKYETMGKTNTDFIPNGNELKNIVKKICKSRGNKGEGIFSEGSKIQNIFRVKNLSITHVFRIYDQLIKMGIEIPQEIQIIIDTNYYYDTITSLEKVSEKQTYDLEIEDIHQFKADGFIVHNSQGSTYDVTIVHEQDINSVYPTTNRAKSQSIYTALTRSRNITIVISEDGVENNIDFSKLDLIQLNDNINKYKNETGI